MTDAPSTVAPLKPAKRQSAADHAARGAEEERERVRKVLHDGLGQLLTSISFLAGSLRQRLTALNLQEAAVADDIMDLTRQAIGESQRLIGNDAPPPSPPPVQMPSPR